jgi:hypothetical protein
MAFGQQSVGEITTYESGTSGYEAMHISMYFMSGGTNMGMLQNCSIYLSGAIEAHQSPTTWRNQLTPKLKKMGMIVYDPLVKPTWMPQVDGAEQASWKKRDGTGYGPTLPRGDEIRVKNRVIRQWALALTNSCNMMVVKLEKKVFTAGTFEEIKVACDANKPVFIICDEPDWPSMWLVDQVPMGYRDPYNTFFNNEGDFIEFLRKIDTGEAWVDPIQWIFLTHNGVYPTVCQPGVY